MRSFIQNAILCVFVTSIARANQPTDPLEFGDDRLRVQVSNTDGDLRESSFTVLGKPIPRVSASAWSARIDGQEFSPGPDWTRVPGDDSTGVAFEGAAESFRWMLRYTRTGPGRVSKSLRITPTRRIRIEEVSLWDSIEAEPPTVASTTIQDIAALYRAGPVGLFVSLDFPYSRIDSSGGRTRVSYPPHRTLQKGEAYDTHSLTIGAVERTGIERYGYDTGEVAAMDAYVQERFSPRFERPMILSCSIVNRYTQVRGDAIFYTMRDHPTLRDNTDLLERELALMPELGVEYYQVFPGVFDWGPNDPSAAEVTRLMDVARRHGVRMGDYSGTSHLFCPHYNEYRNGLDRPEWRIRDAADNPAGSYCFGCSEFIDHYLQAVVPSAGKFGFEIHCLDFLGLQPCHASNHGHPPGRDSFYHAVCGLVRLLEAIRAVSPEMMTWSNSGNWAELLPKIAWYNPNLYLTDPFISTAWQGLNMTRLLDDARREQMVSLHHTRFIPYRFLSNCQYFFSQNSVVPDIRHYEYGALSTLAVTPNLCLGEIRPWLDRLPEPDRKRVVEFYHRWTGFVRENYNLWKKTYQLGDAPGTGSVEVYSHADGDRGYIFVVNPHYWSQSVSIPLDPSLGFRGQGDCEITERYPTQRLRLTSAGPTVRLGSPFTIDTPAQQVIVLEVRPAPASIQSPRLYGIPGTVERNSDGYTIRTAGMQGRTERAFVAFPPGSPAISAATVRADVPKIPKRLWSPTPLQLWTSPGVNHSTPAAVLDLTFRREPVPDELRNWLARPGTLEEGLAAEWHTGPASGKPLRFPLFADVRDSRIGMPMTDAKADQLELGPLANFCGAYIENAFGEMQETWIDLAATGQPLPPATQPASSSKPAAKRDLPARALDPAGRWWLQTRFNLPFMYTIGAEPAFDEHTILVLPLLRHHKAKRVSAWVNGQGLDVRLYRYPRNRSLGCYYADLVGTAAVGGENKLVVYLEY